MDTEANDHFSWFTPAFHDFRSRFCPPRNVTADFFKHHQAALGFDKVEHILSIGPDDGQYDIKALEAFPACRHYTAIEPSKDAITSLGQNIMKHYPSMKQTLVQDKVEGWCGPTEKLEMILAVHVLYDIQEPKCEMLEKFISWLKPGGMLVIILGGYGITYKVWGKLKNFARARRDVYLQPMLKEDLQSLGANIICEKLYKFDLNLKTPTKELADFFQFTDCTDEEVQEVNSIIHEVAPDGLGHSPTWITVVRKNGG